MPAESLLIVLNGEPRRLPEAASLLALLDELGVAADTAGVAVAVNDVVVPRPEWEQTRLATGDRVEVVRPVQGG